MSGHKLAFFKTYQRYLNICLIIAAAVKYPVEGGFFKM